MRLMPTGFKSLEAIVFVILLAFSIYSLNLTLVLLVVLAFFLWRLLGK